VGFWLYKNHINGHVHTQGGVPYHLSKEHPFSSFLPPCRIYSYSREPDLIFWIYTYYYQSKSIDRPEAQEAMSSADQVFRRVGRGGAGNWYSKKDVEEVEKTQATAVGCPFAF